MLTRLKAEQVVIGAILMDCHQYGYLLRGVRPVQIRSRPLRQVWYAAQYSYLRYGHADEISVNAELLRRRQDVGGLRYLDRLVDAAARSGRLGVVESLERVRSNDK